MDLQINFTTGESQESINDSKVDSNAYYSESSKKEKSQIKKKI